MSEASRPNSESLVRVAGRDAIEAAARRLRAGDLVALPTETGYGLAARADRADAVAEIYRAKGRPSFNPLIVHVLDIETAARLAVFDDRAQALAQRFWPGALTLVLPLKPDAGLAPAVTAGLKTVALRCPAHPVMRAILAEADLPLAAPSANRSGAISPSRAEHVLSSLGIRAGMILDAGPCPEGIESTIIALREGSGWQVLRPGPKSADEIAEVLGEAPHEGRLASIEAPGQLASHYAPAKAVRLEADKALPDEFHIGFGAVAGDASLSRKGDAAEAAARLYALLHEADASAKPRIAVAPIPDDGMGIAINDRLRRAAS